MRKSTTSLKPIQKSKNYTNIVFPNCDAILYSTPYVLSFQKYSYKNIDLKLDFLNC